MFDMSTEMLPESCAKKFSFMSSIMFCLNHWCFPFYIYIYMCEVRAKRSEQRVCIGMEYDSKPRKPKGNGKPKAALSLSFLICI